MNKTKMFFSLSPVRSDIDAIKIRKPKYLLLSYGLWRKSDKEFKIIKEKGIHYKEHYNRYKDGVNSFKNILNEFHNIGYYPKIILDSGAFSFKNNPNISLKKYLSDILSKDIIENYYNGLLDNIDIEFMKDEGVIFNFNDNELINVSFTDEYLSNEIINIIDYNSYYENLYTNSIYMNVIDHIRFIQANYDYIDYIISLDDMNSSEISIDNWKILRQIFNKAIPTFHIGENEEILKYYIDKKSKFICLGGIAQYRIDRKHNNESTNNVANWTMNICNKYPNIKFHLFGCQSQKLLSKVNHLNNLYSVDGATWARTASKQYKKMNRDKVELLCELIDKYNNVV